MPILCTDSVFQAELTSDVFAICSYQANLGPENFKYCTFALKTRFPCRVTMSVVSERNTLIYELDV